MVRKAICLRPHGGVVLTEQDKVARKVLLGDWVAEELGENERVGERWSVGEGEQVAELVGDSEGDREGEALAVAVRLGVPLGLGLAETLPVTLGDRVGDKEGVDVRDGERDKCRAPAL